MTTKKSLLLWGGFMSVAYLLTQVIQSAELLDHYAVTFMWVAALAVPLFIGIKQWPIKKTSEGVVGDETGALWVVLCLIGMSVTAASLTTDSHDFRHFAFRTLWFIIGAVGFAYVGGKGLGKRRVSYFILAGMNLLVAVALFINYDVIKPFAFGLAVFIQGFPMLVDGLTYFKDESEYKVAEQTGGV